MGRRTPFGRRAAPGDPKLAVGYSRCSTDRQELGPQAQRQAMAAWCERERVELVEVHADLGISGAAPLEKRTALLAALDDLRRHNAGLLVVAKRDRLARDVVAAAMIERLAERNGARVVAAAGTSNADSPEAGLMRGIIDLFAQYERAVIRSRTRAALAVKRARGERVGGIPYGYRLSDDGVHVEPDVGEQAVIDQLVVLRDGMSLRKLAAHCREHGIVARDGAWSATTLSRLFRRLASEASPG